MAKRLLITLVLSAWLTGCASQIPQWEGPHSVRGRRCEISTDCSPEFAKRVLQEADSFIEHVERILNKSGPPKFKIYLFEDFDDFRESMHAHGEGIAYFGEDEPVIAIPKWPLETPTDQTYVEVALQTLGSNWKYRLRHELVHGIFYDGHDLDRDWLWEGVADYFAHIDDPKQGLKAQRILSLKQAAESSHSRSLSAVRTMPVNAREDDAELRYSEAWSLVYTLFHGFSPTISRRFMSWLGKGCPGTFDAFMQRAGLTSAQIDRRRKTLVESAHLVFEVRETTTPRILKAGDQLLALEGVDARQLHEHSGFANFLARFYYPESFYGHFAFVEIVRSGRLRPVWIESDELKHADWLLSAIFLDTKPPLENVFVQNQSQLRKTAQLNHPESTRNFKSGRWGSRYLDATRRTTRRREEIEEQRNRPAPDFEVPKAKYMRSHHFHRSK